MARTQIPVTTFASPFPALQTNPGATAADQANGMYIDLLSTSTPVTNFIDRLILVVTNSAGSTPKVIVRAGTGQGYVTGSNGPSLVGPAFRAALGDYTSAAVTAGSVPNYISGLEWARFATTAPNGVDPAINIDFTSGFVGTILALFIPRSYP